MRAEAAGRRRRAAAEKEMGERGTLGARSFDVYGGARRPVGGCCCCNVLLRFGSVVVVGAQRCARPHGIMHTHLPPFAPRSLASSHSTVEIRDGKIEHEEEEEEDPSNLCDMRDRRKGKKTCLVRICETKRNPSRRAT